MSKKANITTQRNRNVFGLNYSAQSRQFPGVTAHGDNAGQVEFIFRKQARGSRKAMLKGRFPVK